MNTYKITNLTNTVGKREFKYNSSLSIEYVSDMMKKTATVRPGESLYLTVSELPISVHRLRVKNLVSVVEISQNELENLKNQGKPKAVSTPVVAEIAVVEEVINDDTAKRSTRKKKD